MQSPHTETPARDPWPWVVLALVLLLAILAAWPLLTTADFLTTRHLGDSPFLLFRTQQLADALADGVFPVRWMPDGAFGLGYPFFHYYAALPFYLAAGLHLAGVPLVLSLKITVVAGFALAAWGMYGWVYAMTRHRAGAVLAAVAYTLAPYHLVNVYLRGDALSEFWAMSWYPLILWSLYAAAREPSRPRLAAVAVSYGALVLTHNVSALLFSPFVALYALGLVVQNGRHRFGMLAGAGILGLALAAWFWFPALNETDAVQLDGQAAGFFFYGNHFRSGDLIQADWAFDYTVLGEDANAQALGRMQGLLMGLGALAVIWRFWRYKHAWRELFILGGLGLSLYMITPDSEPLWANVPLLELAQFPWRFLSIVALFGAASTAALADLHALPGRAPRLDAGIVLVVGGLLAYTSLTNLETDFIPLRDDDITAERMHAYEAFTGALGTTIGGEYLPRWVDEPPHTSDIFLGRAPRAQFLSGEGDARRVDTRAHAQTWRVDIQAPGAQVALPLHYWPGWRAQADGRAVQAAPLQGMGYTQVNLPPGEYDLHLRLGRPAERLIPELLSLAALGVVLGLAWPALRRIPPQNALGALLSVVFVIFILGLARPEPDTSLVTADFAQRAFHHPQAATYRDGVRWLGADVRQIGGELELTFNWDRVPPGQLRVELAPSLGLRSLGAPLYPLTTGARLDADIWQATFGLNDIAPGVYFPRVMRFPAETDTSELRNSSDPLTEHGYGRGPLHLLPVVIPPGDDVLPAALAGNEPLRLAELDLYGTTSTAENRTLQLTLWWVPRAEIPLHYGVDIRLIDQDGHEWAQFNALAGNAGLYPTGLWVPRAVVPDAYRFELQGLIPPGEYRARVSLYDPGTLATLATGEIEGVTQPITRPLDCNALHRGEALTDTLFWYHDGVASEALQGTRLGVVLAWAATAPPPDDLRLRWIFSPEDDSREGFELETLPAPGSSAAVWDTARACGADMRARHGLRIPADAAPGAYTLRVQALADDAPLGAALDLGPVQILEQTRLFELPAALTALDAVFEDGVRLRGYALRQTAEAVEMDIAWGAGTPPSADYRYFVHLYPADDLMRVLAQQDAMPQAGAYPTSRWVADEVVPDAARLSLDGLPPGDYVIGLGWYLPGENRRLAITQADAETLPDARVILPVRVRVP